MEGSGGRQAAAVGRCAHRVGLRRVVPHVDVGVVEGLLHGDAALGVDDQHFGEQVPRLTRCYGDRGATVLLWGQTSSHDIISSERLARGVG